MKKKTKKFGLIALGTFFSVAFGLACASCGVPEPIVLENFDDMEITADLDASYTLPIGNVTDTEGNDYRVTFEVETKSGKKINAFNNSFRLKYFEDYYIYCSADLGGGDVRTRTITLKVQDTGAPVITFGTVKLGMVDKAYTLPETTVEDSSKESLTATLKVFELDGDEKGEELTVTDNSFTPTQMGYYLIEATATDSNGNVGTETTKMFAREQPDANEIVSFKYTQDIECVGWSQKNGSITWEEEFEGETGVAKFSYTGTYWANAFSVLPLQDVSENSSLYDDYDTLIVRMYIKNDAEYTNCFTQNDATKMVINKNAEGSDSVVEKAYHTKTDLAYNQWVDFAFDIKALSAWDNQTLNVYQDKLWGYGVKKFDTDGVTQIAHKGEFYVAGIFCANKVDVTANANSYAIGNTVTFSTTATDSNVKYTLSKPDGTQQTLSGNTYMIDQKGVYTVNVFGDDYYGSTKFTATRAADYENEVLSFNHADDIAHVHSTSSTLSIIDEWEGETGVLKVETATSKWPTVAIKSLQTQANHETHDRISFRVWIPTDTGFTQANIHNTSTSKNHKAVDGTATLEEGKWIDVKFSVAAISNWSDEWTAQQLLANQCGFFFNLAESKATTFYIADVRLEKKVNVVTSGSLTVGGTITVSAKDKENGTPVTISGTTVTVTAPSGKTTTLTGNMFIVEENGTHTVTLTGKYVGTTTFSVRSIGENEIRSFNYAEDIHYVYSKSSTLSIIDEWEGETGVLKVETATSKWPTIAIKSLQTQAKHATYSRIVFRVWIPTGTGFSKANINNTSTSKNHSAVDGTATLEEGKWIDIKFAVAAISNWADDWTVQELLNNQCAFFFNLAESKATTFYIADISLA
ncbi:MAG: hypothetical protein J6A63_03160 [Clostridia bacterium]|nr:hypothetical protein [Clostridia bacterium]